MWGVRAKGTSYARPQGGFGFVVFGIILYVYRVGEDFGTRIVRVVCVLCVFCMYIGLLTILGTFWTVFSPF